MNSKNIKYTLFQFISLLAWIILAIAIILLAASPIVNETNTDAQHIKETLKKIFIYDSKNGLVNTASTFIYFSITLTALSWAIGWATFANDNRNYYDLMFLMFLMIPLISNLFCLFAQLGFKHESYQSRRLSSEDIEKAIKELKKDMKKIRG